MSAPATPRPGAALAGFVDLVLATARGQLEWAVRTHPDDPAAADCRHLLARLTAGPSAPVPPPPDVLAAWVRDADVSAQFPTDHAITGPPDDPASWYPHLAALPAAASDRWQARLLARFPGWPPLADWLTRPPESNDPFDPPQNGEPWLAVFAEAGRAVTRLVVSSGPWHRVEQFGLHPLPPAARQKSAAELAADWATVRDATDPLARFRALVAFDEGLNELVSVPLPAANSAWARVLQNSRDALLRAVAALRGFGHDVQVRPLSGSYVGVAGFVSDSSSVHIPGDGPPGEILWCVRLPCRVGTTTTPGRVIYRSPKAVPTR